jgi:hypothetical protein
VTCRLLPSKRSTSTTEDLFELCVASWTSTWLLDETSSSPSHLRPGSTPVRSIRSGRALAWARPADGMRPALASRTTCQLSLSRARGLADFEVARSAPFPPIARRESFAPTRWAQTPSVAARGKRRRENHRSPARTPHGNTRTFSSRPRPLPKLRAPPAKNIAREGRITIVLAKGQSFCRTQGAFVRRTLPLGSGFGFSTGS